MQTTYILTSNSTQFINEQFNYFNTEIRNEYTPKYSFNLIRIPNSIIIETNCPYIYNSDGYQPEATKYNATINEIWVSEKGDVENKIYRGNE